MLFWTLLWSKKVSLYVENALQNKVTVVVFVQLEPVSVKWLNGLGEEDGLL